MHSLFHPHEAEPALAVEPVPNVFPTIEGAGLAAAYAGQPFAGDFYDSIRVSPERVLFGLLDVAGRREENRAILAAAQKIFRELGTELFARPDMNESDAVSELCLRINRGIIDASSGVRSCPAFLACYHEKFGTLCYTNAGHTPGLVRDASGVSELSSTGLPMGLFSHATCDAPTVGIESGAALLLVSRGVIEWGKAHDKEADEFGLERVQQILKTAPSGTAEELCATVLKAVGEHSSDSHLMNDRTAIALVRKA